MNEAFIQLGGKSRRRRQLLEHDLIQNLCRWRKVEPRRIPPFTNPSLRLDGHMIDGGTFYIVKVHCDGVIFHDHTPFYISISPPTR